MRTRHLFGCWTLTLLLVMSGCASKKTTETASESLGNGSADAETSKKQKKAKWKMQLSFPDKLTITGEAGVRIAKEIGSRTSNALRIKHYAPGRIVPPLEVFDAVADGRVDAAYTTAVYAAAKYPSANFFTAVPFGAEGMHQYEWVRDGEGRQLLDELFEENIGVKALPCSITSTEGGGWFKKPITNAQDMNGLKMRFFGLGGKVAQSLGVRTQLLRGSEIYPSLKRDAIDGVEFASPAIDIAMGFHEIAKYYYYPAWHQKTALNILIINQTAWNSISDETRLAVENVCHDNILYWLNKAEELDTRALSEFESKGVTVQKFPEDVLKAAEQAWENLIQEEARSDEMFGRTSDAYRRFLNTL